MSITTIVDGTTVPITDYTTYTYATPPSYEPYYWDSSSASTYTIKTDPAEILLEACKNAMKYIGDDDDMREVIERLMAALEL